ncbi:hypothetical protein [Protaetiibacter mangrovi]|uniref:Uncharacterized protein n=1 Tax=Protaetiibacter mangrovi TaxID=2970926 RepID=A0ABT1ZGS3_9MICO|nr:hypothetical protein [Protaetiibacter mangrovi]MCS0499891.1 hypothetical protein [Protaetiibacter mangrovi]
MGDDEMPAGEEFTDGADVRSVAGAQWDEYEVPFDAAAAADGDG